MIFDLSYQEIDLLLRAVGGLRYVMADPQYRHDTWVLDPGSDDPETSFNIATLSDLEARLEELCHQNDQPVATAWEREIRSDKGRPKFWHRMVEVRVVSEMLYVFRARAEDLIASDPDLDPIRDHSIVIGDREYRSTAPAPAEVYLKALVAFRGVSVWLMSSGLTSENVKKGW